MRGAPPTAPPGASGPSSPEEMAGATASRPGGEDSQSLSERILVHLYWYGRSNVDGVARADASQAGMARRLGVAQNSLSKALRRLVDAGALIVELQHVPGAPRRLKTYALTSRGEAVARRIRADAERRPKP
jgi:DNA-binding MarR family transcriptional regulator